MTSSSSFLALLGDNNEWRYLENTVPFDDTDDDGDALSEETQPVNLAGETQPLDDLDYDDTQLLDEEGSDRTQILEDVDSDDPNSADTAQSPHPENKLLEQTDAVLHQHTTSGDYIDLMMH